MYIASTKSLYQESIVAYTKSLSFPRKLALWTFGELLIVFSTKVNLLYLIFSTTHRCCLLHLIKQNYLLKTFLRTLNLDDSGILSRTNLKLHNICVTPKMVSTVIINFDLLKESVPDCIPVVVLQSCKPKLSYILAELFNMCVKDSFQIVGRFPRWSLYLRLLGKSLPLKTTTLLVFFLWLIKSLKTCK